jgi:hypothetical protein
MPAESIWSAERRLGTNMVRELAERVLGVPSECVR